MRHPHHPLATASCALAALFCLTHGVSRAASQSWSASPSDTNWSDTNNWTGGAVPGNSSSGATPATDIATFNAPIPGSGIGGSFSNGISFDTAGDTIGGITFDTSAGSYVFKGDTAFISSGGSILLTSAVAGTDTETFYNAVEMAGGNSTLTIENDSPSSAFNFTTGGGGSILGGSGACTLYLTGAGTANNTIAMPVYNGTGGTLAMVVNGSDEWVLTNDNTFSGGVTINSGTLAMGFDSSSDENVNSLGSGLVAINGGQLRFGGAGGSTVNYTISNNITATGGTLFVGDGNQILSGSFAATSGTTYLYTQWSGKNLNLNGVVSGTGAMWVNAPNASGNGGGAVFFNNNANTYSGTVTVDSAQTGFYGGIIYLGATDALANATVVNNGHFGGLDFVAGIDSPVLGALAGSTSFPLADQASTPQPVALTVGGNNASTTFTGALSGSGSLIKAGAGTFAMNAISSYSGGTTVNAGILQVGNGSTQSSATLGSGTVTINAGAAVQTGFISGQATAYPFANSFVLNGGALFVKDGDNEFATGSSATFNVLTSGTLGGTYFDKAVSIPGAMTGSGNLTIVYSGFDTGAETYDGSTVDFDSQLGAAFNTFTGSISVQPNTMGITDVAGNYLEIGGTYALANATLNLIGNNSGSKGTVIFAAGQDVAYIAALTGSGNITIADQSSTPLPVTLNVGGGTVNVSATYSGIISGAGTLVVGGTAPFVLTGANTYTGQTIINPGATFQMGNGTGGGSLATTGTITDNGALVFDRGINIAQGTSFGSGALTGSGGIVQSGIGNLTLNNASNNFTGNVTVNSGTLTANISGNNAGTTALGSDASAGRIFTLNGGTLDFTSNNVFGSGVTGAANIPAIVVNPGAVVLGARYNVVGVIDLNGGTVTDNSSDTGAYQGWQFLGTITVGGTAASTISSAATGATQYGDHLASNTTFNVGNVTGGGVDLIVSAALRNQSGDFSNQAGGFTKTGAGTMLLSGSNTYTGATNVSAGTLIVSGSVSGSSAVTVASGATLASGNNTTSFVGAVADYGTLAPGSSGGSGLSTIGTLNMGGSLTLGTTGTGQLAIELGGTASGQYDSIAFSGGGLDLANAQLDLSLVNGFTPVNNEEFILTLGANSTTGHFTNVSGNILTLGNNEFAVSYNGVGATGATGGGDDLILVAIPEPHTLGMLLCGASMTILLSRKRKSNHG